MNDIKKNKLNAVFFQTDQNKEPVREWLKSLTKEDRKAIGEDIMTVQFGWPLGMPLVRSLGSSLWEVRSKLEAGIARVVFFMDHNTMILVHGFVKKTMKTPKKELELAKKRKREYELG